MGKCPIGTKGTGSSKERPLQIVLFMVSNKRINYNLLYQLNKAQKNKPEQVTPAIQRNKIEQKKGDNKTSDNNSNTWITLTVLIIHDSGVIVK